MQCHDAFKADSDILKAMAHQLRHSNMFWMRPEWWRGVRQNVKPLRKAMAYEEAGREFAQILVNAIGGPIEHEPKTVEYPKTDFMMATDMAAGVLYGITDEQTMVWYDCFENPSDFVTNMQVIYKHLEDNTYAGTVDGVTLAVEQFKNIEQNVAACPSDEVDASIYATWASGIDMDNLQLNIQYNLQHQKHMLKLDKTKARKHFLNEEFFALGQDLEEIVSLLTTPRPQWMQEFEDRIDRHHPEPHHERPEEHHREPHHKQPEEHHKKPAAHPEEPKEHHRKPHEKPSEPKDETFSVSTDEQVDLSNYYI